MVKRQEALAAARLRMQEELNLQVEKHKEKLKQVLGMGAVGTRASSGWLESQGV